MLCRQNYPTACFFGVPDTNQRSVCGGESEGIGRFNERGAISQCEPIAERVSNGFMYVLFQKWIRENTKANRMKQTNERETGEDERRFISEGHEPK